MTSAMSWNVRLLQKRPVGPISFPSAGSGRHTARAGGQPCALRMPWTTMDDDDVAAERKFDSSAMCTHRHRAASKTIINVTDYLFQMEKA